MSKDSDGQLVVAGVGVRRLAEEVGTPAYVVDEADLKERARAFAAAFDGWDVYYAAKSFLCTAVARWVVDEGLGIDVCTGGELAVVLRAGVPPAKIALHGNNKSPDEIAAALQASVGHIVVDSFDEIARLSKLSAELGVRPGVLVRRDRVIRAVGLANDGRTGGLLVPAEEGQERAMRLAYERAGVAPETVTLVECHATGTPVGDSVEARSTGRVFAGCADLPIGSVKSNVGHLLTAAGGAGLLKVLGAMRAGIRPASLGADDPIDALGGTPLRLLAEPEEWPGRRRAGISAFGFGGANAHLVLDAWEPGTVAAAGTPAPVHDEDLVITAVGAKVADGADATDLRRAVLLGEARPGSRAEVQVGLAGLRFPPHDLAAAHAQHVLLLEAAREATAGRELPRGRTAVIVGMGVDAEVARHAVASAGQSPGAADVLGTMPNLVANRINTQLDLINCLKTCW